MRSAQPCLALLLALTLCACVRPASVADEGAAGAAFLARNAAELGIHVTRSGLQYKIVRLGPPTGLRPKLADEVKVNYEGKLLNGQVFDSSFQRGVPLVTGLDPLIPGWVEALRMMRPGDEWLLYVPPSLGYGAKAAGAIPANSVLVFRIDLLAVLPDDTSIGRG